MTCHSFYVSHKLGEEYVEYEYEVEFEYEPYVEARISGPPENCSPAEGGYATDYSHQLRRRKTDPNGPWETVAFSVFMEGIIEQEEFVDDPMDKPYAKTAHTKAIWYIESELSEAGEQSYADARDAAEEDRYDYYKDEGLL